MDRKAGFLAAILFAVLAAPLARSQGTTERRTEVRVALARELQDYAEWCRGKQYFLERRRVLESILAITPEDEPTMRALGYVKDASGKLVPPEKDRVPKNFGFGEKAQEEARARYAAAVANYLERMNALRADGSLTGTERASIVEEMLLFAPDDPVLRAERGEVQHDGVWVMEEVEAARVRRAELEAVVDTARADAKLEPADPTKVERTLAFGWKACYRTAEAQILGTVPAAELERCARSVHAARALFGAVFGVDGKLPENLAIYLFASPQEGQAFLSQHPIVGAEEAERAASLSGLWIPGAQAIAYWAAIEEIRIDGVVRLLFEVMMGEAFHTAANMAWVHEGFGFLLAERVTGTRLSWFARADAPAGQGLRVRMLSTSDWLGEAKKEFCSAAAAGPHFPDIAGRTFDTISSAEVLYAYAIAAYLIEGRAGTAGKLLQRMGYGREPVGAVAEVLGFDADALDARTRRWLAEREPSQRTKSPASTTPAAANSPLKPR